MATVVVFLRRKTDFFSKDRGGLKRIVDIGGVIFFCFFFGLFYIVVSRSHNQTMMIN